MKNTHKHSGMALILAVLASLLLLILGGALLRLGSQTRIEQIKHGSYIAARSAADAGLIEVLNQINTLFASGQLIGTLPADTDVPLVGANSCYSYNVAKDGSTYTVYVTGSCNGALHTVEASLDATNPFDFSIFSEGNIILRNSATIDWYNNDPFDEPLKVGTNSTLNGAVDLKNSIKIKGDVVVGPGADPSKVIRLGNSAVITGQTYAQPELNTLPPVTVPAYLQSAPSRGSITNNRIITTSGKYDAINLGNSKKVTISGPVEMYVQGDVDLGNSCKIELDNSNPHSSLTLYLNGNLELANSSELNNKTQIPRKFKIYGTENCTNVDFKNSANIYGVLYTPDADVVFHNSIELRGSIAGKTVDMKNSAKVWYDASLRDVNVNDGLASLKIKRWTE